MTPSIPSEADCKRTAFRLNDSLEEIFDYARRKRLILRPFTAYERLAEVWKDYPDGWEDNVLGMLAAFAVCGQAKTCAAFVRSIAERLPDEEIALAREWRALPWIWSCFTVKADLGGSRLTVKPLGERPATWPHTAKWGELALYSPTVAGDYHRGVSLFLAMLVACGRVFHTYGVIIPFRSFSVDDLFAFADCVGFTRFPAGEAEPLAGVAGRARRISDIIAADPLPFLRLFEFAEMPRVVGRRGPWRKNVSTALLPAGVDASDPAFWRNAIVQTEHKIHSDIFLGDSAALYLDGGSPMYDPAVYISFADRRVYLVAAHEEAYDSGREALLPVVRLPEDPQVSCSLLLETAVRKILKTSDSLDLLRAPLDTGAAHSDPGIPVDQDGGPIPTFDEAERVLDRLTYNHNEGIEETDEEVAGFLNVSVQIVTKLRSSIPGFGVNEHSGLPPVDRMGLSPRAYHQLLSRPVPAAEGALVLCSPEYLRSLGHELESMIAETPILRFAQWSLGLAGKEGGIPATKAGYVKPLVVHDAAEAGVIKKPLEQAQEMFDGSLENSDGRLERMIDILRPKRELDSKEFIRNRKLLEAARFIRLRGSGFVLTAEGEKGQGDPIGMYHHLIVKMFESYEWNETAYFDSIPGIRERGGFLFYAAHVLCGEQMSGKGEQYQWAPVRRLTEAFIGTFPDLAQAIADRKEEGAFGFHSLMELLIFETFVRFFGESFGLLESRLTAAAENLEDSDEQTRNGGEEERVFASLAWMRPTPLMCRVFRIGG